MPRTVLPPTPGPSSDIKGQAKLLPLQMTFELPPPAISGGPGVPSSALVASRNASDSSAYPMQASEMVKSRRRASAAQPRGQFTLPPPPTRQRKIIQMKPRESLPTPSPAESPVVAAKKATAAAAASRTKNAPDSNRNDGAVSSSSFASSSIKTATPAAAAAETGLAGSAGSAAAAAAATTTSTSSSTSGTKRKQASSTTAAGRKIARKTAHSEIERRRRSKMNEGFALLKSMIPACTDEMHKLSILQASIDYIRYLEDCNSKLKTRVSADAESRSSVAIPRGLPTPSGREPYQISRSYPPFAPSRQADNDVDMENVDNDDGVDITQNRIDEDDEDEDEDEEGDEDEQVSPRSISVTPGLPSHGQSRLPSISPALLAADSHQRTGSYSSVAYSYGASSATASPAVGPRTYGGSGGTWRSSNSTADSALPSPALLPMRDHDQEATAGLLMLVASAPPVTGRGMSVSDLLIK